jgi:hypothetical protein
MNSASATESLFETGLAPLAAKCWTLRKYRMIHHSAVAGGDVT